MLGTFCAIGLTRGPASGAGDAVPLSPRELLEKAFARRYEHNTRQTLSLVVRAEGREIQRQRIAVATEVEAGRIKALGRFTEPPEVRDTALLMLEGADGRDDFFLYLPALMRVRRVSTAQRGDSFMGTDLTYDDIQRPRVRDFTDFTARRDRIDGEDSVIVGAKPARVSTYSRLEFTVATRDSAILLTRYFKGDASEPYKLVRIPRAGLREIGGALIPTRISVQNFSTRTETEVFVEDVEVGMDLDDTLFTTNALAVERDIPERPAPR
jgi:hypothetical protein